MSKIVECNHIAFNFDNMTAYFLSQPECNYILVWRIDILTLTGDSFIDGGEYGIYRENGWEKVYTAYEEHINALLAKELELGE